MGKIKIGIVGGGAAGFFAANVLSDLEPDADITILEKSGKVLSKVLVSGGGRCNVTHDSSDINYLREHYPRGHRAMSGILSRFGPMEVKAWFRKKGMNLITEADGRMFPSSNSSREVIEVLSRPLKSGKVKLVLHAQVSSLKKVNHRFVIHTFKGEEFHFDALLIACGGKPDRAYYSFLEGTGHAPATLVPSLFTLETENREITKLSGISVPEALLTLAGGKISSRGPLLITHKGLSGPAILRFSSLGAAELANLDYRFTLRVSWLGTREEEWVRNFLLSWKDAHPARKVKSGPDSLPERLWLYFLSVAGINPEKNRADLSKKEFNGLLQVLAGQELKINGKHMFKEEFVTCGGVGLNGLNPATMESKTIKGLFFAGEVLDIDGFTGGFNFQSCWSTAYLAAHGILNREIPKFT
jgi:predicted Rossmann fold flavoprotein